MKSWEREKKSQRSNKKDRESRFKYALYNQPVSEQNGIVVMCNKSRNREINSSFVLWQ